jgi:hypothetical protein
VSKVTAKARGRSGARAPRATTGMSASAPSRRATAKAVSPPTAQRDRAGTDWRATTLARMRALIGDADPDMIEEQKWKKPSNGMTGVPVWSHHGMVCTGEIYTKVVKLTFARGASLPDPARLFNASLTGGTRRAIDIREGDTIDAAAFKALVTAAVAFNTRPARKR